MSCTRNSLSASTHLLRSLRPPLPSVGDAQRRSQSPSPKDIPSSEPPKRAAGVKVTPWAKDIQYALFPLAISCAWLSSTSGPAPGIHAVHIEMIIAQITLGQCFEAWCALKPRATTHSESEPQYSDMGGGLKLPHSSIF